MEKMERLWLLLAPTLKYRSPLKEQTSLSFDDLSPNAIPVVSLLQLRFPFYTSA